MIPYIKINELNMDNVPGSSISMTMEKGEVVAITGANGSGKTTLAGNLSAAKRPSAIGKVIISGLDPFSQLDEEKLHKKCGVVYQNPSEGIVYENVIRDLIFGAENQGLHPDKIKKRAKFYLKKYDLSKVKSCPYASLSASQQQRVALCSILIMHPEILILDEAFSMQGDSEAVGYMKQVIKGARKHDQTIIVFSKNRNVLELADRIYELSDGYVREIDHETLKHLDMLRSLRTTGSSSGGLEIHTLKPGGGAVKLGSGISLHNVTFGYDRDLILDNYNIRFEAGGMYQVSGEKGSGKTTFLKILGGMLKPLEGEVFKSDSSKVGYVPQYPEEGFVSDTVLDDIMFGPMSDGYAKVDARIMAEQVLSFVNVKKELWNKSPLDLSAGQQRLVSIAGALALNPDILLLDHPYAGLDQDSLEHIQMIIEGISNEGKCIIIAQS